MSVGYASLFVFHPLLRPKCMHQQNDEASFGAAMHKANYGTYDFVCRAKQDTYNVCRCSVVPAVLSDSCCR
jgi:hypothetical protein